MRRVTREDFRLIIQGLEDYDLWLEYKDFAEDLYGKKASKVKVEVESEYNDEGGYYFIIDSVQVLDAQGNAVAPDLSLPAWQAFIEMEKEKDSSFEADKEFIEETLQECRHNSLSPPPEDITIDLSREPNNIVRRLYITDTDLRRTKI